MPTQEDLVVWLPYTWRGRDFRRLKDVRKTDNIRRGVSFPLTVISQYEHSWALRMLLQGEEYAINPAWEIADFWAKVFHPRTCIGWGLDIWARIVGCNRTLQLRGIDEEFFGFLYSGLHPFNQAPFYDPTATTAYTLSDVNLRKLIFMKAAINITDGTLASLNRIMQEFFADRGQCMVLHVGTMKIRFLFYFELTKEERAMLLRDDVPPVPAGVGYDLMTLNPDEVFGFYGSGLQPFGQGVFVPPNGVPAQSYTV